MTQEIIEHLLNKASKLGAKGYEVIGFKPPEKATDDPYGYLEIANRNYEISETPWFEK